MPPLLESFSGLGVKTPNYKTAPLALTPRFWPSPSPAPLCLCAMMKLAKLPSFSTLEIPSEWQRSREGRRERLMVRTNSVRQEFATD